MSQFDYGKMQNTASRLIARFKQGVIVYTAPGTQSGPDYAPVITPGASYTLDATATGVSEEYVDGTQIIATDTEVTAAVFGAVPTSEGTLTIDGAVQQIVGIKQIPAAGTPVVWKIFARA